jgi:hypothetical protein
MNFHLVNGFANSAVAYLTIDQSYALSDYEDISSKPFKFYDKINIF